MRVEKGFTKASRIARMAAMAAMIALGIGSCQLLGVTKMDRLSLFGAALSNPDKSLMSANFAQGQTADYAIMDTQAYWDAIGVLQPGSTYLTYSISVHDYVDPANVTADIYGPPDFYNFFLTSGPVPAVFVLVQIGPDWFIKQMYLNGGAVPAVQ
jgi:hypothetical protein